MTDVIERIIHHDLTAPDIGSVEAKARVFHYLKQDLPLDACQLVESLGTSRPEQVCVRIESALSDVEIAELYDFGEHCGRAGSVFSLDIIMSDDADVAAYRTGADSWLHPIVSTTKRAVKDNMVRWIIPIRAPFMSSLSEIHELARSEFARPTLIMPEFIHQTIDETAETKQQVLDYISDTILGADHRHFKRGDLAYFQALKAHLEDPVETPKLLMTGLDIDGSESFGFQKSEILKSKFSRLLGSFLKKS